MMKKNLLRKTLAFLCVGALIACVSVAATIAYFTDSEAVTNTFTVGRVGIAMDESQYVATSGEANSAVRVQENEYQLVPGKTYPKDPTIHVDADSEDCYLFVKVENGIEEIETKDSAKTIAAQLEKNKWLPVDATVYPGVYYLSDGTNKKAAEAQAVVKVFSEFTIDGASVNGTTLETYKNAEVNVTAYAIQAAGFEDTPIADIWEAGNWE